MEAKSLITQKQMSVRKRTNQKSVDVTSDELFTKRQDNPEDAGSNPGVGEPRI